MFCTGQTKLALTICRVGSSLAPLWLHRQCIRNDRIVRQGLRQLGLGHLKLKSEHLQQQELHFQVQLQESQLQKLHVQLPQQVQDLQKLKTITFAINNIQPRKCKIQITKTKNNHFPFQQYTTERKCKIKISITNTNLTFTETIAMITNTTKTSTITSFTHGYNL